MITEFLYKRHSKRPIAVLMAMMAVFCFLGWNAAAVNATDDCPEIDDMPLDIQIDSSPPNLLFMIDDSGSMDWEFSTTYLDGKLHEDNSNNPDEISYLYDSPENFYSGGSNGEVLEIGGEGDRGQWRATWRGFNKLYYGPKTDYKPWVAADGVGTNDPPDGRMPPADMDNPKFHPTVFLVDDNGSVDGDEEGTNMVDHERNAFDLNGTYKRFEAVGDAELGIILDNVDEWSPDSTGIIIDNEPVTPGSNPADNMGIILDDEDGDDVFTKSNGWGSSSQTPQWNGSSLYTGNNNKWAKWTHTFSADEAGSDYVVQGFWVCNTNRDENAKYTITDAADDHVVYVDQKEPNCGQWITIGTDHYTFNDGTEGSVEVRRTNSSTGSYTQADAVRFITQTDLDNPASIAAYDESSGWDESTTKEPSWNGDSIYTNDSGAWAAWANEFTEAGTYKVQGWWPCDDDGDLTAQITITDAGGTDHTFTVDQRRDSGRCGQWVTIGDTYDFAVGDVGTVKLERTHSGDDETWADAFRFVTQTELDASYVPYEEGGIWEDTGQTPVYPTGDDTATGRYTSYKYGWAEWEHQFTSADAGTYTIQAHFTCTSNRDHEAKYIVTDSDGENEVTGVDQGNTDECGKWVTIGEGYSFDDGTVGRVRVERQGEEDQAPHGSSTYADAIRFITPEDLETEALEIINAHYYQESSDGNIYLVNLTDPVAYYQLNLDNSPDYYKADDIDIPKATGMDDFTKVDNPPDDVAVSSYAEARQNFANFFTYYRRRSLLSIAAVSEVVSELNNVYIGLAGINSVQPNFPEGVGLIEPVLPVGIEGETDYRQTILEALYAYDQVGSYSSTPMRDALSEAGQYFERGAGQGPQDKWRCSVLKSNYDYFTDDNCEPINGEKGACQQNFTILFTDGYYNGGAPGFQNIDNQALYTDDGTQISGMAPYADTKPNTLADVAMYYYANDLADDIDNLVPTKFPDISDHQHMVTYTITFGVYGNLNPDDYTLYGNNTNYPTWPTSYTGQDYPSKIDDMWHAAVNARGEFHSASDPDELIKAFSDVVKSIMDRVGVGASASVSSTLLTTDSELFISGYNTDGWAGVVTAWGINPTDGSLSSDYAWNAAETLEAQVGDAGADHVNNRYIATNKDTTGKAFTGDMTGTHADLTEDVVNYLRGDKSNEQQNGGAFRNRKTIWEGDQDPSDFTLGDIVHSSPVYHDDVVYVGANDGMLHAFLADGSTDAGKELFGFIPSIVHDNLIDLTDPGYTHKYYVDLTPTIREISSGTLLVSGLGKGGKGVFALDISGSKTVSSDNDARDLFLWEFTDGDDMGYSFSKPVIIKTNSSSYPYAVVFGNGYGSANGESILYIVNPANGSQIEKFETGVTGTDNCNGMSSPFAADIDNDGVADFLYSGDLKGNMWKFDISSSNHNNWGFAFENKEPLFTAEDSDGNAQPITSRPDVTKHCSGVGRIVIFGTGQYLGTPDMDDTSQQTLYGIWDYGEAGDDGEYWASHDLMEQEEIDTADDSMRVLTDNEPNWTLAEDTEAPSVYQDPDMSVANSGWYFHLPDEKERIVEDVIIVSGRAVAVSNVPAVGGGVCSAGGGYSFFMSVDPCNGGRTEEPVYDINDDGVIDENDMVEVTDPDTGEPIIVSPPHIKIPEIIHTPGVGIGDDQLYFYNPTDPFNPGDPPPGPSDPIGMTFWRQHLN